MLLVGQRQKGESNKAVIACNDYLRMGPGRSLKKLIQKYNESGIENAPVKAFRTIANWSSRFGWVSRAEEYDRQIEAQKSEYSQRMMIEGLAADYERVAKLKDLFDLLFDQLMEEGENGVMHNLWLPDVKQIGAGKDAERVDIERYNSALISDIRGVLDDLAKETGGRRQKQDIEIVSWETEIVSLLRAGKVEPKRVEADFGPSLAQELFRKAGIDVE